MAIYALEAISGSCQGSSWGWFWEPDFEAGSCNYIRHNLVLLGTTGFTESIPQESPEESADWTKSRSGTRVTTSATSEQPEGSGLYSHLPLCMII